MEKKFPFFVTQKKAKTKFYASKNDKTAWKRWTNSQELIVKVFKLKEHEEGKEHKNNMEKISHSNKLPFPPSVFFSLFNFFFHSILLKKIFGRAIFRATKCAVILILTDNLDYTKCDLWQIIYFRGNCHLFKKILTQSLEGFHKIIP